MGLVSPQEFRIGKERDMTLCTVRHYPDRRRFETSVDGHDCEIDYELAGKVMTITHTGVPAAVGGRGISGEMMRFALDTARTNGWKVVPACSYAAGFMRRNPEFDDLRV
jgi:predicted GNAT family acetyltransferase